MPISISDFAILTPKARVGEDVKIQFTVRNITGQDKCFKANVWWRQEKVSGDLIDSIGGYEQKTKEITFKMPDKPENPTKFSLNLYEGSPPVWLIGCMTATFNEAPSDFKVFTVEKGEPSRGIKVVLKDPPKSGKVILKQPVTYSLVTIDERTITDTTQEVLFNVSRVPAGETLVVILEDNTGFLLDRKEVKAPEIGTITVTLYGYGGAHYWTKVWTNTTTVISGDPVKISAKAYMVPNNPLGEGYEINFYMRKRGEEEWKFIGSNLTGSDGVAVYQTILTLVEEDKAIYEFMAQVDDEPTYSDVASVAVTKAPEGGNIVDALAKLLNITPEQARQLIIALFVIFLVMILFR